MLDNTERLPLLALALGVMVRRRPDFIVGGAAGPYLKRWHLSPKGDGPAVYIHEFIRSDDDRALHDHPYASTSLLLRGGYLEHLAAGPVLRQQGEVISRDAATPHRVELLPDANGALQPVVTMFICGAREREWGFHCPQGWRPWKEFVSARDAGAIGVGCG